MTAAEVRTETTEDRIAIVRLSRSAARNALNVGFVQEISTHIEQAYRGGARAIVLSSSEPTFCAGGDLKVVEEALAGDPSAVLGELADEVNNLVLQIRRLPLRLACALEGNAAGAGIGIALAADIRICGERARLIPAFLAVGTAPDAGTSHLLMRSLGPVRALSVLARNQLIDAPAMERLGLADHVVAEGTAEQEAVSLLQTLAPVSGLALVEARRLIDGGDLADVMAAERAGLERMWASPDCAEGAAAFVEKRPARFHTQFEELQETEA